MTDDVKGVPLYRRGECGGAAGIPVHHEWSELRRDGWVEEPTHEAVPIPHAQALAGVVEAACMLCVSDGDAYYEAMGELRRMVAALDAVKS